MFYGRSVLFKETLSLVLLSCLLQIPSLSDSQSRQLQEGERNELHTPRNQTTPGGQCQGFYQSQFTRYYVRYYDAYRYLCRLINELPIPRPPIVVKIQSVAQDPTS